MRPRVQSERKDMTDLRQIVVGRYHRVLYESASETVYILGVQHTHQKLPSMRDVRREQRRASEILGT